jgi:FAD dependent oxidoreductase TIGR03364
MQQTQIAVIGAGIVGLAHALAYARTGARVTLFERTNPAVGASIRNFGLVWPIGQPEGTLYQRALRSRSIWLEVLKSAGLWHAASGSLHLAYHDDEWQVLEEFYKASDSAREHLGLLTPAETAQKSQAVNLQGLKGALWSATEINVDPRQVIRELPAYLAEAYGVTLRFGTTVTHTEAGRLYTPDEEWQAELIIICSGNDFETLYPRHFSASGITRCKLQMLRTVPQPANWALGPSLCAGLTLGHYSSFAQCPSLPALKERFQREMPFYVQEGIHVLLSQTALGELTIGDHHEYGLSLDPFARETVDQAILDYLHTFAHAPTWQIAERWIGIYPLIKGRAELVLEPEPGVVIVNALGGAGMTLSFGLADDLIHERITPEVAHAV